MARTFCLACDICIVSGLCKKAKNALEDVALVGAHNKTLSNLCSLDIYGSNWQEI
jgi:hypothetical protein